MGLIGQLKAEWHLWDPHLVRITVPQAFNYAKTAHKPLI
jgi:hypothetical protein